MAFRTDIKDMEFKRLNARKGCELAAFEMTLNEKTFIFCTAYRVNNLGKENHDSILNTIQTFYKVRNHRKIFIIGDFNLSSISWPLLERGHEKKNA